MEGRGVEGRCEWEGSEKGVERKKCVHKGFVRKGEVCKRYGRNWGGGGVCGRKVLNFHF